MFGHGRGDRSRSRATPTQSGRIPTHEPQRRRRLSLPRLGPLHQRHPGRSRSLVRHDDRLHQAPPCIQSSPLHHEPARPSRASSAWRGVHQYRASWFRTVNRCNETTAGRTRPQPEAGSWLTPVCGDHVLTAENLMTGSTLRPPSGLVVPRPEGRAPAVPAMGRQAVTRRPASQRTRSPGAPCQL